MPTIGGINAAWDNSTPSDSESAGLGDDRIRSLKTSIQQALDAEHNFPSGGGANTGYHVMGSARPFYGVQSAVSSTGSDGRLMVTSDTSRLFHVGSGGTMFLGGQNVSSIGSPAAQGSGAHLRHYWVEELGVEVGFSSGGAVTFPRSGFSGVPFTFLTTHAANSVSGFAHPQLITNTATGFSARVADATGVDASSCTLYWRSIGSRVF